MHLVRVRVIGRKRQRKKLLEALGPLLESIGDDAGARPINALADNHKPEKCLTLSCGFEGIEVDQK